MNVIEVRDLSKRYRIGLQEKRHETLAGQIGSILRAPIDNFRRLRDLSRFGAEDESVFWALKDINFDVQQGDVLGIIGHNGAGKSTLLKILSRITEPTSGEIRIKGRISALLEVGTGFHPELTGRENIYMNGTILGMTRKEIDRKLDEIVDFSGVEKYIDTPVKFYSTGMKVRLGFAVAAHLEPEILIIDEVLAVGDAEFQRKCLGKMKDVSGEGRTILFVSHNMSAVSSLCTYAVMLNQGMISSLGITSDVISGYLKYYSNPQNTNWIRNKSPNNHFFFEEINIQIKGEQPELLLEIQFQIRINRVSLPSFVAFDIKNSLGVTIMQAIPEQKAFIEYNSLNNKYKCCIILQNFIPDTYSISCWIGPHFNETYDFIEDAVTFEILNGPIKGRSFPYTKDHGNIIPQSYLLPGA